MKRALFAITAPAMVLLLIWLLCTSMSYVEWGRERTLNEYCIHSFQSTWIVAIGFWFVGVAFCSFIGPPK